MEGTILLTDSYTQHRGDQMSIADKMYDDILIKWENEIPYFLLWLTEVCGIHSNSEEHRIMKSEINTERDIDQFVELFDGDIGNVNRTINKFVAVRSAA